MVCGCPRDVEEMATPPLHTAEPARGRGLDTPLEMPHAEIATQLRGQVRP